MDKKPVELRTFTVSFYDMDRRVGLHVRARAVTKPKKTQEVGKGLAMGPGEGCCWLTNVGWRRLRSSKELSTLDGKFNLMARVTSPMYSFTYLVLITESDRIPAKVPCFSVFFS